MTVNPFWPPPGDDIFGGLSGPPEVRNAVKATLQTWLPTYVTELGKQKQIDLPDIEDWKVRPEYRTLPTSSSAAVMVTCPGTSRKPERKGDGTLFTYWTVQVSILIRGTDWEPTEDLVGYYATAAVAALLQHPDLGGFADATSLLSYRYSEVEHSSTRTLGVGQCVFEVAVDGLLNTTAGPAAPDSPIVVGPSVQTVAVNVTRSSP